MYDVTGKACNGKCMLGKRDVCVPIPLMITRVPVHKGVACYHDVCPRTGALFSATLILETYETVFLTRKNMALENRFLNPPFPSKPWLTLSWCQIMAVPLSGDPWGRTEATPTLLQMHRPACWNVLRAGPGVESKAHDGVCIIGIITHFIHLWWSSLADQLHKPLKSSMTVASVVSLQACKKSWI